MKWQRQNSNLNLKHDIFLPSTLFFLLFGLMALGGVGCTTTAVNATSDQITYDVRAGEKVETTIVDKLKHEGYKLQSHDENLGHYTFLPLEYSIDRGSSIHPMPAKAVVELVFSHQQSNPLASQQIELIINHTCVYPFGPYNRQNHPVESPCKEDDMDFQRAKAMQTQRVRAAIRSVAGIGPEKVISGAPPYQSNGIRLLDPTVTPPQH